MMVECISANWKHCICMIFTTSTHECCTLEQTKHRNLWIILTIHDQKHCLIFFPENYLSIPCLNLGNVACHFCRWEPNSLPYFRLEFLKGSFLGTRRKNLCNDPLFHSEEAKQKRNLYNHGVVFLCARQILLHTSYIYLLRKIAGDDPLRKDLEGSIWVTMTLFTPFRATTIHFLKHHR